MADPLASFRLAGHRVDPALNRITTPSGNTVQVEPKIMQVLTVLAEHAGDVVTRDDLMARVWNGVFVTDDVLHRAIRELRRVFGDEAERPHVIETIRKRGYRLIAPVESGNQSKESEQRVDVRPDRKESEQRVRRWGLPAAAAVVAIAIAAVARFELTRTAAESVRRAPRVTFAPLTSDRGNEVSPALSASGKLAYVARGDDGRAHVFVKSTGNATAVQVTHGHATDHAPTWSPDEYALAFARVDDGGCHIVIAAANGLGDPRVVAPCASRQEFQMSWSPDRQRLAITAGDGTLSSPSHIETLNITTGERRPVTDPYDGIVGDYAPAFSPNGRALAFVRVLSGSVTSLCVVDLDRGDVVRLTDYEADVLGADWDPSGRFLIFSSDRAGAISIWRVDAAAGAAAFRSNEIEGTFLEPELIAGGGNKLKHPSVARRTGAVAYEDWQYEINLRELPTRADGDSTARAISPTADRWNFHPQISPDGKRLVFQSTRSGAYELWISNRDGSGARQLTQSRVYKSMARWSPDGRELVFSSRSDDGKHALYVVSADTGSMRELDRGEPTDFIAPNWSHDGSIIYVGGIQPSLQGIMNHAAPGPTAHLWEVDSRTGRRGTDRFGPAAAIESFDGRWRFLASLYEKGLERETRGSNERVRVADRVTVDGWPNWGVYDRGVYYVDYPDDGDPQLFFVETGEWEPRPMTRLPEMAWPGIAVSRDGSRVIYARADQRAANIGGLQISR